MPVYPITFRQRALIEYAESTAWYKERSLQAAQNFVTALENVLKAIANSPYTYRNSYKKFYEVKIKKFPFNIVYFIDESEQRIVVTTIFHQKRNPSKKFR